MEYELCSFTGPAPAKGAITAAQWINLKREFAVLII